jgi:AcrR family transcriptional regulator
MEQVDRRKVRTRQALQNALIELLRETPYESVTVSDICQRAGVGRSAFYQHYTCKDDLFRLGFERLREDLEQALAQDSGDQRGLRIATVTAALFEHAERHGDVYRRIVEGHAGAVSSRRIRAVLTEVVETKLLTTDAFARRELAELRVELAVSVLVSGLGWWLERRWSVARDDAARSVAIVLQRCLE